MERALFGNECDEATIFLRPDKNITLELLFLRSYIVSVTWDVEFTDVFGEWWDGLSEAEQESVTASVTLLERFGPDVRYPHSSSIAGSRYSHMRELRIQHAGRPYRVLYAFDPRQRWLEASKNSRRRCLASPVLALKPRHNK